MSRKKLHTPTKINKSAANEWARQQALHAEMRAGKIDFSEKTKTLDLSKPLPIDPDKAYEVIMSREMPDNLFKFENEADVRKRSLVGSAASNTVPGAASIAELAAALKNDPQLIYEFVANNIEFLPQYGLMKGAWGCLMDGRGTSCLLYTSDAADE